MMIGQDKPIGDVVYEDARRVGKAYIPALDDARDVFAATRATYDSLTGIVHIDQIATVLDDDGGDVTALLPEAQTTRSQPNLRMRAIRIAVLAACAWEKKVAGALAVLAARAGSEAAQ